MQTTISTSSTIATQATDGEVAGKAQRRNKIIYWTLTLILFLPATAGAFVELFTNGPAGVVKIMLALGYPLYLMKILGFAKILGGIAILTGKLPRMKEWAYAGFTFDFLGATASHALAGDAAHALFPFVFFLFMTYLLPVAQDGGDAAAIQSPCTSRLVRLSCQTSLKA